MSIIEVKHNVTLSEVAIACMDTKKQKYCFVNTVNGHREHIRQLVIHVVTGTCKIGRYISMIQSVFEISRAICQQNMHNFNFDPRPSERMRKIILNR